GTMQASKGMKQPTAISSYDIYETTMTSTNTSVTHALSGMKLSMQLIPSLKPGNELLYPSYQVQLSVLQGGQENSGYHISDESDIMKGYKVEPNMHLSISACLPIEIPSNFKILMLWEKLKDPDDVSHDDFPEYERVDSVQFPAA
ncbi:hypothetical protein STEG23_001651, partial [Scotinomys teguina]